MPVNPKTLLFADDDVEDFEIFKEAFLQVAPDCAILHVLRCDEVVDAIKTIRPDLVFLDLKMPGGDGAGCLKALKQNNETADIPIVIYSTSSYHMSVEDCYRLSASRYFVKPSSLVELNAGIKRIVELYKTGNLIRPEFNEFMIR